MAILSAKSRSGPSVRSRGVSYKGVQGQHSAGLTEFSHVILGGESRDCGRDCGAVSEIVGIKGGFGQNEFLRDTLGVVMLGMGEALEA